MAEKEMSIALFNGKAIRRKFVADRWFFSVVDVVGALTDSPRPRKYWSDLKMQLIKEGSELSAKIGKLKFPAEDGKLRETDCADTEGIFRIIQSIPSKKAEPFKRWLAKVGYERIQEIDNPELAQEDSEYLLSLQEYFLRIYRLLFYILANLLF